MEEGWTTIKSRKKAKQSLAAQTNQRKRRKGSSKRDQQTDAATTGKRGNRVIPELKKRESIPIMTGQPALTHSASDICDSQTPTLPSKLETKFQKSYSHVLATAESGAVHLAPFKADLLLKLAHLIESNGKNEAFECILDLLDL